GRDPPTHATRGDRPHPVRAMDDRARRRVDPMTTSPPPSPGPRAWGSTWLVAGVLLGVAAWAMPSAIQAGDAGEFATVMLRGGVPHPSGYPWMRILGWPARALEVLGVPPVRAAAWPCAAPAIVGWSCVRRAALGFAPPATAPLAVLLPEPPP